MCIGVKGLRDWMGNRLSGFVVCSLLPGQSFLQRLLQHQHHGAWNGWWVDGMGGWVLGWVKTCHLEDHHAFAFLIFGHQPMNPQHRTDPMILLGWCGQGLDGEKVKQSIVVEPTTLQVTLIPYVCIGVKGVRGWGIGCWKCQIVTSCNFMFEGHLPNSLHYTDPMYVYWCEGVEGLDGKQVAWVCLFTVAWSELSPETSSASASWSLGWVMSWWDGRMGDGMSEDMSPRRSPCVCTSYLWAPTHEPTTSHWSHMIVLAWCGQGLDGERLGCPQFILHVWGACPEPTTLIPGVCIGLMGWGIGWCNG